jgi:hypothetical protein
MLSKFILISIFLFVLLSCSSEDKRYDEFFDVYKDILIVREFSSDSTVAKQSIDSILANRDLSEKQFRREVF